MSAPLVSVIMPAHNAAPFIGDAIRSVLAQSMNDLELLIIDDASTDATDAIIAKETDPRIRTQRSDTPLNAAGARNLALDLARGEFIAFLDADDIAVRTRLAEQLDTLHRGLDLAGSLVTSVDEHLRNPHRGFVRSRRPDEIPPTLLFENCLALSSVTARRSALEPFLPEFAPAEDYELWTRLASKTPLRIVSEELVCYRTHAAGVSAQQPEQMRAAVIRIHTAQLDRLGVPYAPIHALVSASTLDELVTAARWLLTLRDANDRTAIYPRDIFRRVLAERWFHVCLDSWPLGWPVWKCFHRSPLAAPTLVQRLKLLRRVFRR